MSDPMDSRPVSPVLRFIRRVASRGNTDEGTGGVLLQRFLARRDEAAFAALVQCYGPLVLGVCRRVLRHEQDAEDAFQATFLVLARKAGSINKRASVGSWLHGVAYRVARKAQAHALRRRTREVALGEVAAPAADAPGPELRAALDEEVNRLPEKYRRAVVLCYLQGKTTEEAARELGCPKGTVLSRLSRARDRLQPRLARRGLAPIASTLAGVLAADAASAAVPPVLLDATVRAGVHGATAQGAVPGLSALAQQLAQEMLHTMFVKKIQTTAVVLLLTGLLAGGAGVAAYRVLAADRGDRPARDGRPSADDPARKKTDRERLQGKWFLHAIEKDGKVVPLAEWHGADNGEEVTVTGTHWVEKVGHLEVVSDYRLDPSHNPKTIDFLGNVAEPLEDEKQGILRAGIYRLEGDTLTLCLVEGKRGRPERFKTDAGLAEAGSPAVLLVYRRTPLPKPPAKPEKKYDLVRAEVSWSFRVEGKVTDKKIILKDRAKVARLASFFPGMGQGRKSPVAGGWKANVSITFLGSKGEKLPVHGTYEEWTEGHGDFKTKPGLKKYIEELFRKAP